VKDFRGSNVNGPDVEPTDDPVITRGVAVPGVAPAASILRSVIEEAFDAHAPQLKAFALAAVHDADAADDLVQETFLRFVRHVRSAEVPDNVPAWLHRVCANLILSRGRRQGVAGRKKWFLVDRTVAVSPEDHVVRMHESARLRDALGELPIDARAALLMAAAGFSPAEIGQAIGRSTNATSTYICRSRVRLREILSSDADQGR
jgi:RNA polymerase sigma-70 factor (ECF subfamily)